MPLGAFIARRDLMAVLTHSPVLGHITTFGGHPVSCAAGLAAFRVLLDEGYIAGVKEKQSILQELSHPLIKTTRTAGLWMAVEFDSQETCQRVVHACIAEGIITDWFVFAPHCLRVAPPLSITTAELREFCRVFSGILASVQHN